MALNMGLTMDYRAETASQDRGWNLPCKVVSIDTTGLLVTVSIQVNSSSMIFQNVTVPIVESRYLRMPIQVGDAGFLMSADTSLCQISGTAPGLPNFKDIGNFQSNMAFYPISNLQTFPDSPNINAVLIQGPEGVVIKDDTNGSTITLTATGITMTSGSASITINHSGEIDINGTLKINGKNYLSHEHGGVSTGTSFSTGVHDP
jgi:hypothetical protein